MMPNIVTLLIAAIVPMLVGFLWYSLLFGKSWMQVAGMTEEKIKSGNMPLIFGLSYLMSFLASFLLFAMVVHQASLPSLFMGEEGFVTGSGDAFDQFTVLMEQFKGSFRTFKHGAFHGFFTGLLFVTPILAIQAMFERKGFKYVALNGGYWIVTLALMGGILCQWG